MQHNKILNINLLLLTLFLIIIPFNFAYGANTAPTPVSRPEFREDEPSNPSATTPTEPPAATIPAPEKSPKDSTPEPTPPTKVSSTLNVPVGNLGEFEIGGNILGRYLQFWYGFLLGTIGILASVMIMWGGFKYLTSAGDKGKAGEGQAIITSAITSIILAFGVYTILYLVNPKLLEITIPTIGSITTKPFEAPEIDAFAGNNKHRPAPIDSKDVVSSGDNSNWNGLRKLTGTPELVNKATNAINKIKDAGKLPDGFVVTSGYRAGNGSSYHHSGQAFDVTWPEINQNSAQEFTRMMIEADPSLSYIIESHGEHGSTWTAYGMGIHFDIRPTPYYEN